MKTSAAIACVCLSLASLCSGLRIANADEAPATPSAPSQVAPSLVPPVRTGFDFGSYGRVGVGMDARGHSGHSTNVVSHGSRLEAAPYLELSFYYTGLVKGDPEKKWRIVLVPAFAGGDLFHYSGDFTSHIAIRNAYAETVNLGIKGLSLWAGSRMYRGDDIYLFDYWPLDNLNTIGAGAMYQYRKFGVQLHMGLNRLNDLYQYQTLDVPPRGLGPPGKATVLDRPRFVASLKLIQQFGTFPGAKISLYGEAHVLPAGELIDPTDMRKTQLPDDKGWVAGLQLGGWLRPYVFANIWLRVAGGLAAYGELTAPSRLDPTRKVTDALEVVGAAALNYESKWIGVQFGAYLRRFVDPQPGDFNPNSYTEGILAARPHLYLGEFFHVAVELSYQARKTDGLDFVAGRVLTPQVFRFSILPLVAPLGRGTYSRPQIYLIYTVSRMNDDARIALYDPRDVRYGDEVVHYLGAGVEWWFNSSYR